MKGLVRALLAAVGVLGILVVVAVVYITTFFDPNDLKPRIIEAVKAQSGLELSLDGPLSWSFYPRIGVSVEDAQAWLPEQSHQSAPFVGFDRAEISVAFAPLLTGDVSVDGLILDGMRLNLARDDQGRGNWQVLLDRLAQSESREDSPESRDVSQPSASKGPGLKQGESQPVAFDIANVQVANSQVHYVDRQRALDVTLANLGLKSSNVSPQSAFPVQLSFDVDGTEPQLNGKVQLKSQMRMDLAAGRYTFEGVTLDGQAMLPELAEQAQRLNLKVATLVADTQVQQYRANGLQLGASLYHPAMQEAPLSLDLKANVVADLRAHTAALNDLALTGDDGLDLSGNVDVADLDSAPTYQGRIALAPLSLRDWLTRFGIAPNSADDQALSALSLTGSFSGNGQRIAFDDLDLTLDQTHLKGSVGAAFDGRAVDFDLVGDRLDLDRYLPPADSADGKGENAAAADKSTAWLQTIGIAPAVAAAEGAQLLPVDWLSSLRQEGHLALDSLTAKGAKLTDVDLKSSGSGGRQRIDSLSANLYGGSLKASSALDLGQTPIALSFTERFQGVDLAPLYADVSGKMSPLRGTLNLQGDFDSRTNTLDGLKQNLDGQAALKVTDGAMLDVNISRQLCTAVATLSGKQSQREWSDDTAFDRLQASVTVTDGVAHNDDLEVAIPGIAVSGKGDVNLVTSRIDYRASARFVDTADQAACSVNPRLAKVDFPIRCQGSLDDAPGQWCGFDREAFQQSLGSLATSEAKRKAGDRVDEVLDDKLDDKTRQKIDDKLGEGASEKIGNKIRDLFQ
ncbi:AsmA family protein [Salinicola rhizosphaerae]|uniref:Cell envelope biogenesis protein AsmA n=1 Tax=Salinicola rhizosphaerae TaxID=1443141 RepID=A0ABQ3EC94_9GAMM|nr:AsmA family protein [Salinicola rhizosphaerae]GHB33170.1 cell envelope biogenesis protein AsmA [Salinicola rhizosphaerae]